MVRLPSIPLPPQLLTNRLEGGSIHSNGFLNNIRQYKSPFQMTFCASKEIVVYSFMPTFKVQVHHFTGSLLSIKKEAKFSKFTL